MKKQIPNLEPKETAAQRLLRRIRTAVFVCAFVLGGLAILVKGFDYFDEHMMLDLGAGLTVIQ